jgi:hypothetical protein
MRNIKEFLGGMGIDPPTVVEKMVPSHSNGRLLPSLSKTDPNHIELPVSQTDPLIKYSGAKAVLWSVEHTDIAAAANVWAPVFWYDTVDDAIWVLVLDTDTSPDTLTLGKIDWDTGGVTVLGSCQVDTIIAGQSSFMHAYVYRASMGSGDLVVVFDGQEIRISTVDGSLVSGPTMLTNGGLDLVTLANVNYITEDGLLAVGDTGFSGYDEEMYLMRNGGIGGVVPNLCNLTNSIHPYVSIIIWGNCVAAVKGFYAGIQVGLTGPRYWDRPDFDRWLNELADSIGLPKS